MSDFTSPSEAREQAIRTFVERYRITCSCLPGNIELRSECGRLECARHGAPVLSRRWTP
jgi:hypothetical protein